MEQTFSSVQIRAKNQTNSDVRDLYVLLVPLSLT
jgi:hypothetical protein